MPARSFPCSTSSPRRRRRRRKRRCSTSTCSAPTRAATRTSSASPSAAGSPPLSSSMRSSPSTWHGAEVSASSPHYPAPSSLKRIADPRPVSDYHGFSLLLQSSSTWTRSGRSSTLPARRSASSKPYVPCRISNLDALAILFLLGVLGFT